MTNKKPWNRVNLPVYSISSKYEGADNMHIITYVSAVSMKPKRFICAIYNDTKTLLNVEGSGEFVLQLLAESQYRLVDLLGKKTGKETDKISRLQKRNELMEWKGYQVLKSCLAIMHLKVIDSLVGGDHKCFLCELTAFKNLNEGDELTLDTLREHRIIRI